MPAETVVVQPLEPVRKSPSGRPLMPAKTVVVQPLGLPCRPDLKVCTTSDGFFTGSSGLPVTGSDFSGAAFGNLAMNGRSGPSNVTQLIPPLIGLLAHHGTILRALFVVIGALLLGLACSGAARPLPPAADPEPATRSGEITGTAGPSGG